MPRRPSRALSMPLDSAKSISSLRSIAIWLARYSVVPRAVLLSCGWTTNAPSLGARAALPYGGPPHWGWRQRGPTSGTPDRNSARRAETQRHPCCLARRSSYRPIERSSRSRRSSAGACHVARVAWRTSASGQNHRACRAWQSRGRRIGTAPEQRARAALISRVAFKRGRPSFKESVFHCG